VSLGRHLEPARGVYAVTVRLGDGSVRSGVANVGRRPTVNAGPEVRLEAHLFDFDADLYGQDISVALQVFLRGEQKFAGLDALRAQIALDAAAARKLLDVGAPKPP
jgi:riboflavin kinase / FMN adenylyltransferase